MCMGKGIFCWLFRGKKQMDTGLQKADLSVQCFERRVRRSCCPRPLTQEAWLRLEGLRKSDAEMWHGPEAGASDSRGSWRQSSDLWVFGGSCCVIFSYLTKQGPCEVWNPGRWMPCQCPYSERLLVLWWWQLICWTLWEGVIKTQAQEHYEVWEFLKEGVCESAVLRNVHPLSLAHLLSPVCRSAFFFYSFWWHREKTVGF